jgi:hypothetical protein
MKKATLFFLLYCALGYGQNDLTGTAKYRLTINGRVNKAGDDCGDDFYPGLHWIVLMDQYGTYQKTLFQSSVPYPNDKDGALNYSFNLSEPYSYTESNKPSYLYIYTSTRVDGTFGCKKSNYTDKKIYFNNTYNNANYDFSTYELNQPGSVTINVSPVVDLKNSSSNTSIGYDDYIDITSDSGILNQYYDWQYTTNITKPEIKDYTTYTSGYYDTGLGKWIPYNPPRETINYTAYNAAVAAWENSWISLPSQFQKTNILRIKGRDFLSVDQINKEFAIRVKTNTYGYQGEYIKGLKCLFSAPHIVKATPIDVACFDGKTGGVKIEFDRATEKATGTRPQEIISLSFLNLETNTITKSLENLTIPEDKTLVVSNLLDKGTYKLSFSGGFEGSDIKTYTDSPTHKATFTINKPTPVAFKATSKDVFCHDGNDGSIAIEASGGATNSYQYSLNGGDWLAFANGKTHLITGLAPGTYKIKVRDTNLCEAKTQTIVGNEIQLGEVIEYSAVITQPASPVSLNYTFIKEPTFYGGSNGSITAAVTGGTAINNNRYDFVWQNSAGVPQTNTTTNYLNGIFTISLNNVPAGTYTLTVKDGNYDVATNKTGCGIINSTQTLSQPDPIVVTLEAQAPRCHADNPFGNETDFNPTDGQRDESQDGIITATVTGGVPFKGLANGGKPYRYFWKKQHTDGTWQDIDNQEVVLKNVAHGNYALNIEDANGIQLGTYVNNELQTLTDKIIFVQQPDKLELTFSKEDVSCGNSNNGSATAIPSGGKAPYQYEWTTGADTNTITGLVAGSYFVRVTDANGCVVQGSVNLPQPSDATIFVNASPPSCRLGNDGHIELQISNGRPPFTFLWSNGATTQDINNLSAGTYTVSIRDGAANSCSFSQQVVLQDPEAFVINLGPDRTLCNGQSHDLNIAISDPNAQYSWTSSNGFVSDKPQVSLTETGTYHAKVTTAAGCIAEDEINIQSSKVVINSEFFLSSQAYLDEKVVLVNTSDPLGENTVWVIPSDVTIVEQQPKFIVLQFNKKGTSTISLKQTQGECYATYSKSITVEERNAKPGTTAANSPYIKDFIATPNPTNGKFSVVVNLKKVNPIKLRLYLVGGDAAIVEKSEVGQKNYMVNFDEKLAVGNYILILETPQQTLVRKIIVF